MIWTNLLEGMAPAILESETIQPVMLCLIDSTNIISKRINFSRLSSSIVWNNRVANLCYFARKRLHSTKGLFDRDVATERSRPRGGFFNSEGSTRLSEGCDRVAFVLLHVEDRQQFRDDQKIFDLL